MLSWRLYSIFLEVQERVKRQSQLQSWLQPVFFDFLLSLSMHAYSGNKRHVSSLWRLINGLWSPDTILYGQGKQKRELVEVAQNILLSSPRELDGFIFPFSFPLYFPWLYFLLISRVMFMFFHEDYSCLFHLQLFVQKKYDCLSEEEVCLWCGF